jgi:hypothetical protein
VAAAEPPLFTLAALGCNLTSRQTACCRNGASQRGADITEWTVSYLKL